jgi:N-acyl-D-aspartate/D-glutamate deacylase
MPAEMLERSTPAARQKGRLQEGADADIVVFDAGTIRDRSTFEKPMEPSVGVRYLVVGGTVVSTKARSCRMCFRDGRCWGRARSVSARDVDRRIQIEKKRLSSTLAIEFLLI